MVFFTQLHTTAESCPSLATTHNEPAQANAHGLCPRTDRCKQRGTGRWLSRTAETEFQPHSKLAHSKHPAGRNAPVPGSEPPSSGLVGSQAVPDPLPPSPPGTTGAAARCGPIRGSRTAWDRCWHSAARGAAAKYTGEADGRGTPTKSKIDRSWVQAARADLFPDLTGKILAVTKKFSVRGFGLAPSTR